MSSGDPTREAAGGGGALGSVRQLEGALEASAVARADAEERLQAARTAASHLLAAAREEAAAAATERRRGVLVVTESEVDAIARDGADLAARRRTAARERRAASVTAALELILPASDESGA